MAKLLSTSIGKKLLIGITGFFLIGFVVTHLAGNFLLYIGADAYNQYAYSLHANPNLILTAEIILLILFVSHILMAIKVSLENRRARLDRYAIVRSKQGRSRANPSSIMLVSGIIILGFVLLHLADLRFSLRNPGPPGIEPAAHTLLVLQDPISAIVYFFGSLFVGFHVWHGFQSVFQTYGLENARFTPWIKRIGLGLAVFLGLGFASFPVWGWLIKTGVLK